MGGDRYIATHLAVENDGYPCSGFFFESVFQAANPTPRQPQTDPAGDMS